ncbi:MAG: hypothetical protein WCS96_06885, partial [Victivallales bacterium]
YNFNMINRYFISVRRFINGENEEFALAVHLSSRIHKSDDVGRGGFGCRGLSAERRAYPKRYVPFRRQHAPSAVAPASVTVFMNTTT